MKKLKEQITGNAAMVFHGSENKKVYKYICEGQWICSNGVYGDGLYTVYDLSGTQTEEGDYGKFILKLYIKDLSNYWCFTWSTFQKVHPIWAKHTNEEDFINYQAEKFNLIRYGYPKNLGKLYDNYKSYPEFLETVDGIIYHGKHDGDCILSYNPYNCRPVAISDNTGETWEKIDEEYIQQYKQTLSNPDLNKSNYKNRELKTIIIPNNVTEIKDSAFENDKSLKSVIISDSVTKIGEYAFISCENLRNVNFSSNSILQIIGERAFKGCEKLINITIPNSVTYIGESAFYECSNLINVTIGNSVTRIDKNAFSWCSNLVNINIPNSVTYIGEGAFESCRNLTKIIIPDSVTKIGNNAFRSCIHLTNITISNSVTEIGECAFRSCGITNITIPDSVTEIGEGAFFCCVNLAEINIPDSVTKIKSHTFFNCENLTSIRIPMSCEISEEAFENCPNLTQIIRD